MRISTLVAAEKLINSLDAISRQWRRRGFTKLYQDILDERCKIKIVRKNDEGWLLETYKERGFWIFKKRAVHSAFMLDPKNQLITVLPRG